jgi:hypothetical protein
MTRAAEPLVVQPFELDARAEPLRAREGTSKVVGSCPAAVIQVHGSPPSRSRVRTSVFRPSYRCFFTVPSAIWRICAISAIVLTGGTGYDVCAFQGGNIGTIKTCEDPGPFGVPQGEPPSGTPPDCTPPDCTATTQRTTGTANVGVQSVNLNTPGQIACNGSTVSVTGPELVPAFGSPLPWAWWVPDLWRYGNGTWTHVGLPPHYAWAYAAGHDTYPNPPWNDAVTGEVFTTWYWSNQPSGYWYIARQWVKDSQDTQWTVDYADSFRLDFPKFCPL